MTDQEEHEPTLREELLSMTLEMHLKMLTQEHPSNFLGHYIRDVFAPIFAPMMKADEEMLVAFTKIMHEYVEHSAQVVREHRV